MRTLLPVIIVLLTALFAQGFDWKDYDVPRWWVDLGQITIAQAMCLLYSNFQRPSANVIPENTTALNGSTSIPLARHHIIPGNTLMDFFNTALRENAAGNHELGGLLQTLGYLAENFNEYYDGNDQVEDIVREQLRNITMAQLHFEAGNDVPLNFLFDANQLVRSIFYWMPGNIFMGPENRANDAGSSFEMNAESIVQNEDIFERFRRLYSMMNLYIHFRQPDQFRMALRVLQELIRIGRREPYPFDVRQWHYAYTNNNGLAFYDFNPISNITTTTIAPAHISKRYVTMRPKSEKKSFVEKDPLCILPIVSYELALKKNNLMIAANVLDKVQKGRGFKHQSYDSWRAWLESFSWKDGLLTSGLANHAKDLADHKYGYVFEDNSFAVGIVGADFRFGDDTWTRMCAWNESTVAGKMFFDKNGRPVALAMSDDGNTKEDKGWIFLYTRRQMFLLLQNNPDPVQSIPAALSLVFPEGRTESYCTTAMTFEPRKIVPNTHDSSEYKKKK